MQPHLYQNLVLTGGNCLFPGFRERVQREVRALAPADLPVAVLLPPKYVKRLLYSRRGMGALGFKTMYNYY